MPAKQHDDAAGEKLELLRVPFRRHVAPRLAMVKTDCRDIIYLILGVWDEIGDFKGHMGSLLQGH